MGALLGLHEKSVIGATIERTTTGATANVQILADAQSAGPARYLVMCDQAVYLKQGDSTVVATANDFRLPADSSFVITVRKSEHSYLAALQFDTPGTVKITRLDDEEPQ